MSDEPQSEPNRAGRALKWTAAVLVCLAVLLSGVGYWAIRLPADPNRLAIGARAPSTAALVGHDGKAFRLEGLQGLPVLVFYRGHW